MDKKVLSVSEISRYIARVFDEDHLLRQVIIKGEVDQVFKSKTGHVYFDLKDENSKIKCIIWSSLYKSEILDNNTIIVYGRVQIHQPSGSYSIIVSKWEETGLGVLFMQKEHLRKKLDYQGWFNDELKKPIPTYPLRLGIITSENSQARQDVENTLNNRYPLVEKYLFPTLMQGNEAASSVVHNIQKALHFYLPLDLLIIVRGGGSITDLWCFNDEKLLKAMHDCRIPIITGLGHKGDTHLADFIADKSASTPTEAASLAVPDRLELLEKVQYYVSDIKKSLNACWIKSRNQFKHKEEFYSSFAFMKRLINIQAEKLSQKCLAIDNVKNLINTKNAQLDQKALTLNNVKNIFKLKKAKLAQKTQALDNMKDVLIAKFSQLEQNYPLWFSYLKNNWTSNLRRYYTLHDNFYQIAQLKFDRLQVIEENHIQRLNQIYRNNINSQKTYLNNFLNINRFKQLDDKNQKMTSVWEDLNVKIKNYEAKAWERLRILDSKLQTLNPLSVLKRGFSITQVDNKIVNSINDVGPFQELTTILIDGKIVSNIKKITN